MLYPEIKTLREKVGCRYYLVSMAAKRAREIIDGSPKLNAKINTEKPVSIAVNEIAGGYFSYRQMNEKEVEEQERAAASQYEHDNEDQ